MSQECKVRARFFPPPAALRRYFTTFYLVEVEGCRDLRATDYLQPEWANLRFHTGAYPDAARLDGQGVSGSSFAATGPSSRSVRFTIGPTRMWGIGLLPLGWAKYVREPASALADAVVDGNTHPAFAHFAPLGRELFTPDGDDLADYSRICAWFEARGPVPVPDEARIVAIHSAVIDPEVSTVSDLVEATGTSQRTVERICQRAFGFSPKLLLRRQRFMRSLSQYMLDPSLKWVGAMDGHYHDQAQFVRDFHAFMGMTPRQYAAMPHPILTAIMTERARLAGAAVQTLDSPAGTAAGSGA